MYNMYVNSLELEELVLYDIDNQRGVGNVQNYNWVYKPSGCCNQGSHLQFAGETCFVVIFYIFVI